MPRIPREPGYPRRHHFRDLPLRDVSGNGQIGALDASQILSMSVGLRSLSSQDSLVADVDGSGDILAYDASLVQQCNVGFIDRFPVQTNAVHNHPS